MLQRVARCCNVSHDAQAYERLVFEHSEMTASHEALRSECARLSADADRQVCYGRRMPSWYIGVVGGTRQPYVLAGSAVLRSANASAATAAV